MNGSTLVAFHDTTYPDWRISALLYHPDPVDVDYLASVSACSVPGCQQGGSYLPKIQVAYSAVADKFLAVSVFGTGSAVFVRGQIYSAATGALGPTINFSEPWESATHGLQVGVASNPDPSANASGSWTVFAGLRRFSVLPSGSYSAAYITPAPASVAALQTLHHTRFTSDPNGYEMLNDHFGGAPISSERHSMSTSVAGTRYPIDGDSQGCAEALAHGTNRMSLALWSMRYYNTEKQAWEDGVCRRLVDH